MKKMQNETKNQSKVGLRFVLKNECHIHLKRESFSAFLFWQQKKQNTTSSFFTPNEDDLFFPPSFMFYSRTNFISVYGRRI